jgi:heterodisulfide reductase subunit C
MSIDDDATAAEELDRDICLKRKRPELKRVGACYNCGEMCSGIFCDSDCGTDYDRRELFNKGREEL